MSLLAMLSPIINEIQGAAIDAQHSSWIIYIANLLQQGLIHIRILEKSIHVPGCVKFHRRRLLEAPRASCTDGIDPDLGNCAFHKACGQRPTLRLSPPAGGPAVSSISQSSRGLHVGFGPVVLACPAGAHMNAILIRFRVIPRRSMPNLSAEHRFAHSFLAFGLSPRTFSVRTVALP